MPTEQIYLIDGTSLCYRAFFAIKVSTSKGFPTGAVYGFYQTLKKILTKYKPKYVGVCFDVSRKTFRQERFKQYKMHRPPVPDGLRVQIPIIKGLLKALGMPVIEKEGFEADDVIASLVAKALDKHTSVVIVSSDKDLFQLIEEGKVSVYKIKEDKIIKERDFIEQYGFTPNLIVDYLSLLGDTSDNIPGARGIGKIGAAKLIKEFKTIENIFDNMEKIPAKTQKILQESRKNIFLSKELVKLNACDLDISWDNLKKSEPDLEKLYEIFNRLEFKGLLKDLPKASSSVDIKIKENFSSDSLRRLGKQPLNIYIKDKVFIFSPPDSCVYRLSLKEAEEIIQNDSLQKISCGFKSQISYLPFKIKGAWFDVEVAAYILDSSFLDFSLPSLVSYYLDYHASDISNEHKPFFIYKLYEKLMPLLQKEKAEKLFFEVEMPLLPILAEMEENGIKVDSQKLEILLDKVDVKIKEMKKTCFSIAGKEFNLNSPKQLAGVLFNDLKIKPLKKTKTGYSTNEEVLHNLSLKHPIAVYILEYRQLTKLKTTYILPLIEEVNKAKGRLHAQFNQTITQTGRLSSSSPNLQSIPVKGEFASDLRQAFVTSHKGGCLLSADYSQIELRILAHLSEDKNLLKAFGEGLDIHNFTASILFDTSQSEINKPQRNIAKRVNFGIIYGMSPYGLSRELKISSNQAQEFIDNYFKRYPGVNNYIDKVFRDAKRKGFVKTLLGRKRNLPDINSPNIQSREFARRQAVNTPIQGSCADLIKLAMVKIYNELKKLNLKTKLILQIHDELIFDVPEEEVEEVRVLIKKNMETALELKVPVKVNLKAGSNWGQMQELK
ncbi:MAG: DNA polymerase I [Candidatus Omnitrophica bacterium]|nr:DNA polymerase I [Candidatus Omnitrophota bacterium]MBD3269227.1 DNA polymerase I [Candidatus Omnitrophota bacterium]